MSGLNEDTATPQEVAEAEQNEALYVQEIPLKKERTIFKGNRVTANTISQYINRAVQIIDPGAANGKIPGTIILQRVQPGYNRGCKYLTFAEPRQNYRTRTIEVKDSFEMNVLTGEMGKKYNDEYSKWARGNLATTIPHPHVTMGCDPEIFVVDANDQVIPAWKFLGSKKNPSRTWEYAYGEQPMYWDGFQAEFTTYASLTCLGYVGDSIAAGIKGVYEAARGFDKKAKLSIQSVLPVDPDLLASESDEHVEFGCMPSYNAYGLSGLPTDGRSCPIRFAGGHIHFGMCESLYLRENPETLKRLVWHLDAIAGVACVSLFENWDNPVRRQYYGLPGEYRLPAHGLEYRTLSNAWLAHPLIMNLVMELSRRAYALGLSELNGAWEATEGEVLDCILRSDVEVARAILKRNKDAFIGLMRARLNYNPEVIFGVFMRDMSETIKDPADVYNNWCGNGWTGHTGNINATWYSAHLTVAAGKKV